MLVHREDSSPQRKPTDRIQEKYSQKVNSLCELADRTGGVVMQISEIIPKIYSVCLSIFIYTHKLVPCTRLGTSFLVVYKHCVQCMKVIQTLTFRSSQYY